MFCPEDFAIFTQMLLFMKKCLSIGSLLLATCFLLLQSCKDKTTDPQPADPVTYTYRLNYDTTYAMSNTGGWSPGTGQVIDSMIYLHYGINDSLVINGSAFAYNPDMDLYYNSSRTTVSFSGTDRAFIGITYVNGVGHQSYHHYKGYKE